MIKKMSCLFLAILFVMVFSMTVYAYNGVVTVSRTYMAGYTVLNYNYFFTGELTKTSSYLWQKVTDDNTETVFVDPNTGVTTSGYHYTKVYHGSTYINGTLTVNSGDELDLSIPTAYSTVDSLRLRIQNGASDGRGYRTRGTFEAVKYNPDF